MTRRPAQPTAKALARRKEGVNAAFRAPMLPAARDYGEHGADVRRLTARANVTFPVDQARRELLRTIERLAPKALTDLAKLDAADDGAIAAWASRYRIDAPWMHVTARNTLRLWQLWPAGRGRRFDLNLIDRGKRVPSPGRLPDRPDELVIRRVHFEWFVCRRVLRKSNLQIRVQAPETVQKAVQRLAHTLGL